MFFSSLKHGKTMKHLIQHSLDGLPFNSWACEEKSLKEGSVSELEQNYALIFLNKRIFPTERKLNGVSANL